MRAPVPSTAAAKAAVSVAMPLRRCSRFSASRSPREDRPQPPLDHGQRLTFLHRRAVARLRGEAEPLVDLMEDLGGGGQPGHDAVRLRDEPSRAQLLRIDEHPRGDVVVGPVLAEPEARDVLHGLVQQLGGHLFGEVSHA